MKHLKNWVCRSRCCGAGRDEGKSTAERTAGRSHRYDLAKLESDLFHDELKDRKNIAYVRVSSRDQKYDLERQKQVIESYCAKQVRAFEVIADLGSGLGHKLKRKPASVKQDSIPKATS